MYGGTDNGIYNNVITAFPNCGLTLNHFKNAVANYMEAHPDYVAWCEKVKKIAMDKRLSVNGFGRVRILMGDDRSIARQALNSPVQGTAADVARETMADCQEYIDEKSLTDVRWKSVKILLQIHDELVFEVKKSALDDMKALIKQEMESALPKEYSKIVKLLVDIGVGKNWLEAH